MDPCQGEGYLSQGHITFSYNVSRCNIIINVYVWQTMLKKKQTSSLTQWKRVRIHWDDEVISKMGTLSVFVACSRWQDHVLKGAFFYYYYWRSRNWRERVCSNHKLALLIFLSRTSRGISAIQKCSCNREDTHQWGDSFKLTVTIRLLSGKGEGSGRKIEKAFQANS